MSTQVRPGVLERRTSGPVRPYLTAFACWWLLAMLATSVRISFRPWRYVLELFWWQALLLERTLGLQSEIVTRAVWLLAYAALAVFCCWILERHRSEAGIWRRAWIASAVVQFCLLLLAMATSAE